MATGLPRPPGPSTPANGNAFVEPQAALTRLEAIGWGIRREADGRRVETGNCAGGLVSPREVYLPVDTVLMRGYDVIHARAAGQWWVSPAELGHLLDMANHDDLLYAAVDGHSLVHAVLAIAAEWQNQMTFFDVIQLKQAFKAYYGDSKAAVFAVPATSGNSSAAGRPGTPDSRDGRREADIRAGHRRPGAVRGPQLPVIFGGRKAMLLTINGIQRPARQLFIPQMDDFPKAWTVIESAITAPALAAAICRNRQHRLPFE